jgi:hypothetical protein
VAITASEAALRSASRIVLVFLTTSRNQAGWLPTK